MARPKKGKARAPQPAPEEEEEEGGLAPIPEDQGYENWDNYGQGGEEWPAEDTPWGGAEAANEQDYDRGDQWGQHPTSPQAQAGWGPPPPGQGQHPQQQWGAHNTSPAPPPPPANAPAWAQWGRAPQGAYGVSRTLRTAQAPPQAAPPPAAPPSRTRHDSGATTGAASWQNWGAEAAASAYRYSGTRTPGTPYGQAHRVAFASNDSYIPVSERAEMTPHAQRMIFESIMSSRGGTPKQGAPRSARSSVKQAKRSKKEKKAHDADQWDPWGGPQGGQQGDGDQWDQQDDSAWEKDGGGGGGGGATTWDQEGESGGYGWGDGKTSAWDQPEKDAEGGGGELDGDGYTDSEGWNDVTGRKHYAQNVGNAFVPAPIGDTGYPMPSRTMAYASGNAQDMLDAYSPGLARKRNTISDYANIQLLESYGEALKPAQNAFFGRQRKARDRIHWQFPHDKDDRVRQVLEWISENVRGIGAFGLNKFLQTRERGALFINASYDSPRGGGPALDWLTYDDVVETRDRLLQESVGFYEPGVQVYVFVLLPSKTGNSVAMWRRKVPVPDSVQMAHIREIELAKAALRRDYPVWVDEIRPLPYRPVSMQTGRSAPLPTPPPKKKKKGFFRRLFRIFKFKIQW